MRRDNPGPQGRSTAPLIAPRAMRYTRLSLKHTGASEPMTDDHLDITEQQQMWRNFCRVAFWSVAGIAFVLLAMAATLT